jgi:hypothetical protein
MMTANHTPQRTQHHAIGCNRCVPCAGSLSLGLGVLTKRILRCLLMLLFCSSCSSFIAVSGRNLEKEIPDGATPTQVHARLGKPIQAVTYRPPRSSSSLLPFRHLPTATMLSGFEDFRVYAKLADLDQSETCTEGLLLSGGISETFAVPFMLYDAQKQVREGNLVRVFYRVDHTQFAHLCYGQRPPPRE